MRIILTSKISYTDVATLNKNFHAAYTVCRDLSVPVDVRVLVRDLSEEVGTLEEYIAEGNAICASRSINRAKAHYSAVLTLIEQHPEYNLNWLKELLEYGSK